MTIVHDLRVTLCVCSKGSALFHINAITTRKKKQNLTLFSFSRAGQGKAVGQGRAGQGSVGQGRAGQGRAWQAG